jgi:hypothetical protein
MRILAVTITALALCATATATASPAGKQRLVVRGDATAVAGPCDAAGCPLALLDGRARGTISGAYTATFKLKVAKQFPNGEGGICAPLKGRINLGSGKHRLVLAVSGNSCQDGGGPLEGSSFTGLANFRVKGGYRGGGVATFTEDAAHHHRMTLIGRLGR